MLETETETDVTQEEPSDSTSDSEIIIKAKQSLDKLFSDNEVDIDLEAILHVNDKLIKLKNKKKQ